MTISRIFPIVLLCLFLSSVVQLQAQVDLVPGTEKVQEVADRVLPVRHLSLLYEVAEEDLAVEDELTEGKSKLEDIEKLAMHDNGLAQRPYQLKALLRVFSTANLARIHIKVGSQPGSADFARQVFDFDVQDLGAPYSFARSGKTIVLGLGEVTGLPGYYAEVVLENKAGQLSEPVYYGPGE